MITVVDGKCKRSKDHAASITESCGDIAGDGSRCDLKPEHSTNVPHHCCGEDWIKGW